MHMIMSSDEAFDVGADALRKIAGPEDILALESLSFEAVVPVSNTYDALRAAALASPSSPAVTFLPTGELDDEPVRFTYGELLEQVTRAANLFTGLGVGPEDAVSLLLPSLPETQFALWGAEAAGIANPVNFLLQRRQIVELLKAAETRVLVALGPHPASDIWEKVEGLRDQVPTLRHVLRVGGDGDGDGDDFGALLARYPGDRLASGRRIDGRDVAAYFHTGGTTGSPKLALHTHQNQVYSAWGVARMYDLGPESSLGNGLPMFHVAGTIIASLAPIMARSEIVLMSPAGLRNPRVIESYWKLVEKHRLTHIGGVPTSLAALLNVPVAGADLSSVEVTMTGASPLPLDTARRYEEHSGTHIHEIYGMTESAGLIAMAPRHRQRTLGSVGYRMPFEEVKVAALGADGILAGDLEPAADGGKSEEGMLLARGPNVFPGYKDEMHTWDALTEDGWLVTGDLARIDGDGRIYVTGRAKDLIIRSGHNIDPAIVEEAIERHGDVELCAAVGQPDAYAGEVPVVYVTLRPGATVTASELEAFVAEGIAEPPARPRHVYVLGELPVTAVGKIFKPELRCDAIRRVVEADLAELGEDCGFEVDIVASAAFGFEARVRALSGEGSELDAVLRRVAAKLEGYLFSYMLLGPDTFRAS